MGLSSLLIPRLGFVGAPITLTVCDVASLVCACSIAHRDADFRNLARFQ